MSEPSGLWPSVFGLASLFRGASPPCDPPPGRRSGRRPGPLGLLLLALAGAAEGAPAGWPPQADAVVAADGSGQFRSVQEAIFAAPTARADKPWIIFVRPGVYKERLYVQREKRFVALVGENAETTVVSYDLDANLPGPDGKPIGTFRTPTLQIDADDFTVENLTIENAAGPVGQALAIRVDGDRVAFRKCRFLGWQDTVFVNRGRQYFEDCFISGHVDFIFGGAIAFFERCTILARRDGYLTAASTPQEQAHGFVFSHCTLRGESPEVRTYLGRPWRNYGSTVFLDTEMSEVVRPEGWNNWRIDREKTARYAEHGNTGPGATTAGRAPWARALTDAEAAALTPKAVLAGSDGWDPAAVRSVVPASKEPPAQDTSSGCEPPARFQADLEYARPAGAPLRLDLCAPLGRGPFAAALLVHGGGWIGGDRTQAARALRQRLTKAGVAWLAVQYRLAPAVRYPAPVEDVVAAVRWTQRNARRLRLDPARLALVGESAGGHLVVDAAVRLAVPMAPAAPGSPAAPRVEAGPPALPLAALVPFFAPVDLEADADRRGGLSTSMRALFGRSELDEAARQELRHASPIRRVVAGLPPFLLVHGSADMSVPFDQSARLQKALRDAGVSCDLISVPDGTHGARAWDELLPGWADQVANWLAARLAPVSRAPARP